ncbi:MAG TPA: carboxypeptidase-like regulatory domain-containing protein [Pyrinomonadaceae bacterium]|nr:carboxypeptidase-like regulatory domain-containing protein [Pyrinomonadaceae bacterium]
MKPGNLNQIRVASPCSVGWESMAGNDRVRFCSLCQLNVYNFAELTRKEAEQLVHTTEGRICGRLYRRSDGTVITRDCPVGLRALRRKVARVAGAAFATIISLCSVVFAQKDKGSSCRQQVKIETKMGQVPADAGSITGKVLDEVGAVIPGAQITLIDQQAKKTFRIESNDDGAFTQALSPGTYEVSIVSPRFKLLTIGELKVRSGEAIFVEATLLFDSVNVTVGIIEFAPMIDTSTSGTKTSFDTKMIEKLPIH